MNERWAVTNHVKGKHMGLILVLFILLVVALACTSISSSSNSDIGIAGTTGFTVYNDTQSYDLVATSLTGNFESPFPSLHTILPGRSYTFQVLERGSNPSSAQASYSIRSQGQSVGTAEIRMLLTPYRLYGLFYIYVADSFAAVQSGVATGTTTPKTIRISQI
ncbi:hypothetical protein M3223_13055 [Paenibacillus pasadenensis]|uniref:hypothetical protein n=1 Tax=Paenibacillus pasadenensis TaxID=217090 RepID=UPI00203F7AB8|nr:hypothetical protein [Paenibacillus pasadenensis]MCM3748283.1 hypothetical protein [Paenibacillus pasadenensis]